MHARSHDLRFDFGAVELKTPSDSPEPVCMGLIIGGSDSFRPRNVVSLMSRMIPTSYKHPQAAAAFNAPEGQSVLTLKCRKVATAKQYEDVTCMPVLHRSPTVVSRSETTHVFATVPDVAVVSPAADHDSTWASNSPRLEPSSVSGGTRTWVSRTVTITNTTVKAARVRAPDRSKQGSPDHIVPIRFSSSLPGANSDAVATETLLREATPRTRYDCVSLLPLVNEAVTMQVAMLALSSF